VFIAPLIGVAFYYTIKMDKGGWVPKIGLAFAGILFGLTTLVIGAKPGAVFNIATVALERTFAAEGLFIGEYNYFFEAFPHTHLGNVNGINLFVTDPYTLPVGMEMSAFYGIARTENGRVNMNANFFATDGIGGFGLPGILVMGLLCAAVFWVLDSSARRYPLEFSTSALTMIIISLANVSLFTTLLSNGLLVWILIFVIMPRISWALKPSNDAAGLACLRSDLRAFRWCNSKRRIRR
jgi:hypothetical protein